MTQTQFVDMSKGFFSVMLKLFLPLYNLLSGICCILKQQELVAVLNAQLLKGS